MLGSIFYKKRLIPKSTTSEKNRLRPNRRDGIPPKTHPLKKCAKRLRALILDFFEILKAYRM